MQNPTPAPIIVPAVGAPTCRDIALTVRALAYWAFETDIECVDERPVAADRIVRRRADRAIYDGHILCLRPTADRPACVGLTATAFAVASLQEDFAARALVVDPYDAEGNDIREAPASKDPPGTYYPYEGSLPCMEQAAREDAAVAVWEASEAV